MKRAIDDLLLFLLVVLLVAVAVFLFFPLLIAISMAFDARSYLGNFPPPAFSLRWFDRFFHEPFYMRGLQTSLIVAAASTLISSSLGVTAAVVLSRADFFGKQAVTALFLSPLVVPSVVIGFSLLLVFAKLQIFGGFLALLCGHVILTIPYTIRVSLAGLLAVPKSMREASLVLGANEWRTFWQVSFPLARSNILAASIFAFVFSMDDVAVSLFLSSVNTYTLPVAMVGMMRSDFDLSIAAAAVFLMATMSILMLIVDRLMGVNKIFAAG
jgi:putative spermidine/putrescine transport system permease protein